MSYRNSRCKQRGGALIVSIFVIVVMSVMAAAMIRIDWSSQDTTTKEVLGTRAWFLAHSGNEMMLSQLFPVGVSAAVATACVNNTAFTPAKNYNCTATVSCTPSTVSRAGSTIAMFYLESTATCGSGNLQVSRTQETWAKDIQ
ncbi:MSHA biogenesis protein MshP [Photobacterium sp. SDRW27]|uniref:MSHA biogenesis protein MshP n=1 Tax=Photobacterium obscurum TaxID=2829490 RepID=UPI002244CD30|nr:MSHA biogenesis protein MshP [Photobacterium obscurum]MCW8330429.1 MSHA biogenesis protein MshP [Photobacterium obscurum]